MNKYSQISWTPGKCCASRKWGVKGYLWISYSRLVSLIACAPSGAVGHKSGHLDPEGDGSIIYTSSVDTDGRSLNCNNAGASSSGLQALLFWHWLLVRYRSVNHGWKPCCESTAGVKHNDFDLCGTVHVQRAGKREQKIWLKSMNLRLSTASFFACLLFFLHRFTQTVVSLPPLLVCFMSSAFPTTTRRERSASPHASVNTQRARRVVFGQVHHCTAAGLNWDISQAVLIHTLDHILFVN